MFSNIPCCDLFRKCTSENGESCGLKCNKMDGRITLLYDNELPKVNSKEDLDCFNDRLKGIIDNYNKAIKATDPYLIKSATHKMIENRPYVYYRCQYSRLMEYFFPVFHAGKVIAVLMHGQCFPPDFDKKEMFKEERKRTDEIELDEWINNNIGEEYFSNPVQIEDRLKYISKQIKMIEGKVLDVVKAKSQEYVSDRFYKIEEEYRKNINSTDVITDNFSDNLGDLGKKIESIEKKIKSYREALDSTLKEIFNQFNHDDKEGFIRIYAMESSLANKVNPYKDGFSIIGDSASNEDKMSPCKIIFEKELILEKVKEIERKQNKENGKRTIEGEDLLNCMKLERRENLISMGLDIKKDIFRMEISFTSQVAYVIWEKYSKLINIEHEQYEQYNSYLKLMYHTLLEPYFILKGMQLEKDLEASMRISVHESAQIIPSILRAINNLESRELLDGETTTYRGPDQIIIPSYKIIDASLRLLLLEGLFNRSSLIFKEQKELKLKRFDFHRIIYATESLFQEKANWDNMQKINVSIAPELNAYSLKTDYGSFSHVLFNLTDNAIKHGLFGSNIYIKAAFQHNNKKKIIISIISYGERIEEVDRKRIFNLYFRSDKAKKIEGMGIGLFLVKKLCNLLGYEVECVPSKEITNYNLPIKYHYCKQNPGFIQDTSLTDNILNILKKENERETNTVVNTNANYEQWEIGGSEMKSKIFLPTYRNEFQITIPIKENDLKIL